MPSPAIPKNGSTIQAGIGSNRASATPAIPSATIGNP